MKHVSTSLLLLALVLCGLTGCSNTPEIVSAGLRIELTQVQRDSGGVVQATWRIRNPNIVPYVFKRSTHKLTLNGTVVGTMTDSAPLGVPQANYADRTLPLVPANAAASQVIEQALAHGSAAYRLDSTMHMLVVDEDTEKVPLSASGSVPVTAK